MGALCNDLLTDPTETGGAHVRRLGELEAKIMDLLWSWDRSASVRQVLDAVNADRPLAYTTVMTVMDNLHSKGFLMRERDGRAYLYRCSASREDYIAELMRDALAASSDHTAALARFTEQLNDEESNALRSALRRIARRKA